MMTQDMFDYSHSSTKHNGNNKSMTVYQGAKIWTDETSIKDGASYGGYRFTAYDDTSYYSRARPCGMQKAINDEDSDERKTYRKTAKRWFYTTTSPYMLSPDAYEAVKFCSNSSNHGQGFIALDEYEKPSKKQLIASYFKCFTDHANDYTTCGGRMDGFINALMYKEPISSGSGARSIPAIDSFITDYQELNKNFSNDGSGGGSSPDWQTSNVMDAISQILNMATADELNRHREVYYALLYNGGGNDIMGFDKKKEKRFIQCNSQANATNYQFQDVNYTKAALGVDGDEFHARVDLLQDCFHPDINRNYFINFLLHQIYHVKLTCSSEAQNRNVVQEALVTCREDIKESRKVKKPSHQLKQFLGQVMVDVPGESAHDAWRQLQKGSNNAHGSWKAWREAEKAPARRSKQGIMADGKPDSTKRMFKYGDVAFAVLAIGILLILYLLVRMIATDFITKKMYAEFTWDQLIVGSLTIAFLVCVMLVYFDTAKAQNGILTHASVESAYADCDNKNFVGSRWALRKFQTEYIIMAVAAVLLSAAWMVEIIVGNGSSGISNPDYTTTIGICFGGAAIIGIFLSSGAQAYWIGKVDDYSGKGLTVCRTNTTTAHDFDSLYNDDVQRTTMAFGAIGGFMVLVALVLYCFIPAGKQMLKSGKGMVVLGSVILSMAICSALHVAILMGAQKRALYIVDPSDEEVKLKDDLEGLHAWGHYVTPLCIIILLFFVMIGNMHREKMFESSAAKMASYM